MLKQDYDFTLYSPLGERKGTLELNYSESKDKESYIKANIEGYLNIFNSKEVVSGELKRDGTCCLNGKLVTLMNSFQYDASGKIDSNKINLLISIKRDGHDLKMKGVAIIRADKRNGAI